MGFGEVAGARRVPVGDRHHVQLRQGADRLVHEQREATGAHHAQPQDGAGDAVQIVGRAHRGARHTVSWRGGGHHCSCLPEVSGPLPGHGIDG